MTLPVFWKTSPNGSRYLYIGIIFLSCLFFLALLFYKKHCHFICNLVLFKTENVLCIFQALKSVVLYVILAPYDNEQSDLVHRISIDKKLEEIPKYR